MNAGAPWRSVSGGLEIRVRLTPKSAHDRVEGLEQLGDVSALKARVRAVPEDGKANAALKLLIADWLGVPRRSVEVTAGGKSRIKTLRIAGDPASLLRAAQSALDMTAAPIRKRP